MPSMSRIGPEYIECHHLLNLQKSQIGVDAVLTTGLQTVTKEISI